MGTRTRKVQRKKGTPAALARVFRAWEEGKILYSFCLAEVCALTIMGTLGEQFYTDAIRPSELA
jgi:hypothetical protein